ncbi:MAG: WD40 repeat domain-containing protein [Nitrososphaerales archaeon]
MGHLYRAIALAGHADDITSLAFSPDGKTLASGSMDRTIKLWDIVNGGQIRTFAGPAKEPTSKSFRADFSPDGKALAIGSGDAMKIWDFGAGANVRLFTGLDPVRIISPDGKVLASSGASHTIRLLDVVTGAEIRTLKGHTGKIWSVVFSDDSGMLASTSQDKTIKLWDIATGRLIHTFRGTTLAFSPDSNVLAIENAKHAIELWNITSRIRIHTLEGHVGNITDIGFSPDGKTLVSEELDRIKILWDVATGKVIQIFLGNPALDFSPDGKTLVSWKFDDTTIRLWEAATGASIRKFTKHAGGIVYVTFSPDGKMLASVDMNNTIKLWDVATGAEARSLVCPANFVDFSPDGKTLLSKRRCRGSCYDVVKLWDVATGAEIRTFTGQLLGAGFRPDGKTLVSWKFDDAAIKVWDVSTGTELASLVTFEDGRWVVATPDGRFDTNRIDDIKGLHWLMPDSPLTPLPIEIFMRDYYEPKLLPRILAREQFKPVRDFSTLNLTQPEVKIVDIAPDSPETVQVKSVPSVTRREIFA